jgi:hypothetical protein
LGTALDLEGAVLDARSPLRQALAGWWPLARAGVDTLVLDTDVGFIQARRRLNGREADLTYVAPALTRANGAALAWQRLAGDACARLAGRGIERVHVSIAEDDQVAHQVLRQVGFAVCSGDLVLCRPASLPPPSDGLASRPATAADTQAAGRLLSAGRPDGVRALEGPDGDWGSYPLGGRAPVALHSRAILQGNGELAGAWRLVVGHGGAWLRLVAADGTDPALLAADALGRTAHELAGRPVYASARGYEPGLHVALRGLGFEPVVGRFRMIRHTAVHVVEPSWSPAARALQKRGVETAPSGSRALAADVEPPAGHGTRRRSGR